MDFVDPSRRALAIALLFMCGACEQSRPPESLADLTEKIGGAGDITFRSDLDIDPHQLFEQYGSLFQLPADTTMRLVEDTVDAAGDAQLRFQQFHRGIEVEGAELRVVAHKNRARSAAGHLLHQFAPAESTPRLSEERAWEIVRSRMNTDSFLPTTNGSERPQGSLVFALLANSNERVLAWRFDALVEPPQPSRRIYVDAMQGHIVKEALLKA